MTPWRQRPEDAVAVTAAFADSFHFHVPVVARAVTSTVKFDHPLRAAIVAVAVEQNSTRSAPGAASTKFTPRRVRLLPRGQGVPG